MKRLRRALAVAALGLLAGTQGAQAFDGAFSTVENLSGEGCSISFTSFTSSQSAYVNLINNDSMAGGNLWQNTAFTNYPTYNGGASGGPFTVSGLQSMCGLSNVTNLVQNGATGGSYFADNYIGATFRAKGSDTAVYDYEVAISGATGTHIINTRTLVSAANLPPVANAGPNQSVATGASVTLTGAASSDPESQPLSYTWTQTAGTTVTLSNTSAVSPTFTAPTIALNGAAQTLTFRLVVNDGTQNSTGDSIIVTVNPPPNTQPITNAGPNVSVASGASVTLDGSASLDPESQPLSYAWTQPIGPTVTLSSTSVSKPTFTAPTLAFGDTPITLTFRLVVNDGVQDGIADTVTITVNPPSNNPATANAGPDQSVASAASVTLTGAGSNANDAGQTLSYAWTQTAGTTVTLTGAATVSPSFTAPTLAIGAPNAVLTFSLIVNDGVANSVADTVQVTVQAPPNTPATANAGPDQTVASAAAVTLTGAGSNANDAGQTLSYAWTQTSGTTVTLTGAATASPSFTAPTLLPGPDAVLVFSLVVNDGVANSVADTVQVTVQAPANVAPIANAGADQTVAAFASVTLSGIASDSGNAGQPISYVWTQTGGPGVTLTSGTSASPSFTAPAMLPGAADLVLTFSLVVNDGIVDSSADTMTVTVQAPANVAPTADAGADQTVSAAAAVALDGSASASGNVGQAITYSWSQTGGTTVSLTGGSSTSPSFTAPSMQPGDTDLQLTFSLVVNDGIADSAADTVTITVQAPANIDPTANAGADQTVIAGDTVTLDGSGSDSGNAGQAVAYGWTQIGGATVILTGAATASPSFNTPAMVPGDADLVFTFQLDVNDGIAAGVPDTVTVTVQAPKNVTPTANASTDLRVAQAALVTLDGTGSSSGNVGQGLSYVWTQTGGPAVTLSGGTTARPSFTSPPMVIGDADIVLTFSLVVNDGIEDSAADTVVVTVAAPINTTPTANAGPDQTAAQAAAVTLDGSASDSGDAGQMLDYTWVQTSGPTVTLTGGTTAAPSFTAPALVIGDADAVLVFSLVVNDGFADSEADTVEVTVTAPGNAVPVANAGADQTVAQGAAVTLDGSASDDADAGQTLNYVWTQVSGPTVSLTGDTTATPSFTAPVLAIGDADVVLAFDLMVNDGFNKSNIDQVTVTVTAPVAPGNTAPTANAGSDQSVASGAAVALDGSASDANDAGQSLTYVWEQTAGPSVTLSGSSTATPGFTAPVVAAGGASLSLTFSLVVNDGMEDSTADTVTVTVNPPKDVTAPTVVLGGLPATVIPGEPFTVTITFSEPVTGFAVGDIEAVNADVGALTGVPATAKAVKAAPMVLSATVTPTGAGDVSLSVPAGVATDAAGNPNTASTVVILKVQAVTAAMVKSAAEDAAQAQARALIRNQPNLRNLLRGSAGEAQAQVTDDNGTLHFATGKGAVIWLEGMAEWSKDGTLSSRYSHVTLGANLLRSDNLIFGAMVQADNGSDERGSLTLDSNGWLAGPYMVAKLPDQPVLLSFSYLSGKKTYTLPGLAQFGADRTLLTLGVEGDLEMKGFTLIPSLDYARVVEQRDGYTLSSGGSVAAQRDLLEEASFGVGVEIPLRCACDKLDFISGVNGIYGRNDKGGVSETTSRAKISAGLNYDSGTGTNFRGSLFLDGIGGEDGRSYGLEFMLEHKF